MLATGHLLAGAACLALPCCCLDIGAQMLDADGTLPQDTMPDGTHPSEKGYAIWGRALVAAGVRD